MEKIIRWWVNFLTKLESGQRIVAILILMVILLSLACMSMCRARLKSEERWVLKITKLEENHQKSLKIFSDSSTSMIYKLTNDCNLKVEEIYKNQLQHLREIENEYRNIKRKNDKFILKNSN